MVINKRERFYIMPLKSDGATRNGAAMSYIVSASKYWRKVIYAKFWAEIGKYTSGDTV